MGNDHDAGNLEHDVTAYLQSLQWPEREDHWWSVLRPLGADVEALGRVDEEGRMIDDLPRWAIDIRQQIRDFSPCHYSFPHALELLLEGVGNEAPVPSFRGCRSISDSRLGEARQQAGILQKWVSAKGRLDMPSSREEHSPDVNPREMLTTLGRANPAKLDQLKKLLSVLSRERKKGGGMQSLSLNGWKLKQPLREPLVCDQPGCGCLASENGGGSIFENNPVCHFKYFLFVNFHLTGIGTDGRKLDVLSRRRIEREYKTRVSHIRHYIKALDRWLASEVFTRAVQNGGENGEQVRRVYLLLGATTPVKRWLVSSIRETLAVFGDYFHRRVVPQWEMSCDAAGPATGTHVPAKGREDTEFIDDDHIDDDDEFENED